MGAQVPTPNPTVAVFLGYYNRRVYDPSDGSSTVVTIAGISRMKQHVQVFIGATLATPAQLAGAPLDPDDFINPPVGTGAPKEGTLHGKTAVVTTNLANTKDKLDQFKSVSFPVPHEDRKSVV